MEIDKEKLPQEISKVFEEKTKNLSGNELEVAQTEIGYLKAERSGIESTIKVEENTEIDASLKLKTQEVSLSLGRGKHTTRHVELYEISVVSIPMNPYALSKSVQDMFEVEENEENSDSNAVDWPLWTHFEPEDDEVEESETESEEKVEENEEEKSVDDWNESDQNEEEVVEWDNVQEEEKTDESESEEAVEEEHPNEEVETKEMSEEENENVEQEEKVEEAENKTDSDDESVNNESDENSEINDEESVEEDSENAVETQANDEEVVETHNDEVVETKSIETESQKWFDFESKIAQLSKSFDEKLAEKDEKIKSLESKVETMTKLFAESVETIDRMATAVKNTPVNSGLQYKRPLKKWWYYDVASIIKSL